MIKQATLRNLGGSRFVVRTGSGHEVLLDDAASDAGARPAELFIAALGGCTALDVASILTKKRQAVTAYTVHVTGEQRDDPHPHVFVDIDIVHEVEGPEIDVEAVRRAIELSATRYCQATAMLSAGVAAIHHRYLVRSGGEEHAGEVVVTGPHRDPDAAGDAATASLTTA